MATTQNNYTGNGTTTDFAFTFPYLNTTDIKVKLDGVVQSTTKYTLTPSSNPNTVKFNTAPTNLVSVEIYRDTSLTTAKAVFAAGSSVKAKNLNDNQTQALYALEEQYNNYSISNHSSGSTPPVSPSASDTWYDTVSGRTYIYYIDADSSQWVEASPPYDDTSGVTLASKVNFTQLGTGAVQRSVESKIQERISVKDFGAKGDGTTDDLAAFNLAKAYIEDDATETIRELYIPPGKYHLSDIWKAPIHNSYKQTHILGHGAVLDNTVVVNNGSCLHGLTVDGYIDANTDHRLDAGFVILRGVWGYHEMLTASNCGHGFYFGVASRQTLTVASVANFVVGNKVTGGTSGAFGTIDKIDTTNKKLYLVRCNLNATANVFRQRIATYTQDNGSGAAGDIARITYTAHGLDTGDTVELKWSSGRSHDHPADGTYTITKVDANIFTVVKKVTGYTYSQSGTTVTVSAPTADTVKSLVTKDDSVKITSPTNGTPTGTFTATLPDPDTTVDDASTAIDERYQQFKYTTSDSATRTGTLTWVESQLITSSDDQKVRIILNETVSSDEKKWGVAYDGSASASTTASVVEFPYGSNSQVTRVTFNNCGAHDIAGSGLLCDGTNDGTNRSWLNANNFSSLSLVNCKGQSFKAVNFFGGSGGGSRFNYNTFTNLNIEGGTVEGSETESVYDTLGYQNTYIGGHFVKSNASGVAVNLTGSFNYIYGGRYAGSVTAAGNALIYHQGGSKGKLTLDSFSLASEGALYNPQGWSTLPGSYITNSKGNALKNHEVVIDLSKHPDFLLGTGGSPGGDPTIYSSFNGNLAVFKITVFGQRGTLDTHGSHMILDGYLTVSQHKDDSSAGDLDDYSATWHSSTTTLIEAGGSGTPANPTGGVTKHEWEATTRQEALQADGGTKFTVATSAVSTTNNTITETDHGFETGTPIVYDDASGTTLTGLVDQTVYYAIKVDDNTFKVATSAACATAGTVISLTGTGNNSQYFHRCGGGAGVAYVTWGTTVTVDVQEVVVEYKSRVHSNWSNS